MTAPFTETEEQKEVGLEYERLWNFDESGLIGFVEIPCISVNLPIWHGTDAATLEKGIGHLEGSSLPVGGRNTHAILTGHTGLNLARLFTDLTEMEEGDLFFLHIGMRNLAYEVVKINIIEPEDVSGLSIEKDKDQVTLITCTPYGVNTHRLCVTGERTEYTETVYKGALNNQNAYDSFWMHTYLKAVIIGILLSILLLVIACQFKRKGIRIIPGRRA
ncbi:MAG: class C sortase [Clostridiales bacterium]|nr:class C sortase [Clostridiales bacterium]